MRSNQIRTHHWKYLVIIVALALLGGPLPVLATESLSPGGSKSLQDSLHEKNPSGDDGQGLLRTLLNGFRFPEAAVNNFAVLFERHGPELERLSKMQGDLVWQAIDVVIELLPSLSEMDANGGRLRVTRQTYAKVSKLMERCESLASPELVEDLRQAKKLVEGRMTEADQETLVIDFNE